MLSIFRKQALPFPIPFPLPLRESSLKKKTRNRRTQAYAQSMMKLNDLEEQVVAEKRVAAQHQANVERWQHIKNMSSMWTCS